MKLILVSQTSPYSPECSSNSSDYNNCAYASARGKTPAHPSAYNTPEPACPAAPPGDDLEVSDTTEFSAVLNGLLSHYGISLEAEQLGNSAAALENAYSRLHDAGDDERQESPDGADYRSSCASSQKAPSYQGGPSYATIAKDDTCRETSSSCAQSYVNHGSYHNADGVNAHSNYHAPQSSNSYPSYHSNNNPYRMVPNRTHAEYGSNYYNGYNVNPNGAYSGTGYAGMHYSASPGGANSNCSYSNVYNNGSSPGYQSPVQTMKSVHECGYSGQSKRESELSDYGRSDCSYVGNRHAGQTGGYNVGLTTNQGIGFIKTERLAGNSDLGDEFNWDRLL